MKKPKRIIFLLILFTVLTLVSTMTVYAIHQAPLEETTTETLGTYTSIADYDYTAMLEPNTIYNNKTTLRPNEGPIYSKIAKQINITLTYRFSSTLTLQETTISYQLIQTIKTAALQYQISASQRTTTNQTRIQLAIPPVIKAELDAIKRQLETDTGTSSATYTLEITPIFEIDIDTTKGRIRQVFMPSLDVIFKRTEQGDVITIEDLRQTEMEAITENQKQINQEVVNQRYISYIFSAVSVAGVFFSFYFYRNTSITEEKPSLDKLISPYKDLIITAQELPKTSLDVTLVSVGNIQELAKIAEILAKPMILVKEPTPTLTVIDQNTIYQHTP